MSSFRAIGSLIKYRGDIWIADYIWQRLWRSKDNIAKDSELDVIVLIGDHFEPSRSEGQAGVNKVREWCERYEGIATGHRDSDGAFPQHSWFYRCDYPNYECIKILSEYVYKGLGEIEFHLHHGYDTPETFASKLQEGVNWFNQAGAMLSAESVPKKRFGYIAGNWALDNGRRDASMSGVNTELEILKEAGCYADFTFPAFGTNAQPRKVNSIYYAIDTPRPKSYNSGIDVEVGKTPSGDLMLIQGPLYIDWKAGYIEYGALESYAPYLSRRLEYWLRAGVHVTGRPNWIFIKLHTHGMQSKDALLGEQLQKLFFDLETSFKRKPFRLHYVTAREAYNLVKAAEAGKIGNPHAYRNFCISPPANTQMHCNTPYILRKHSHDKVVVEIKDSAEVTEIRFRDLPLRSLKGRRLRKIDLTHNGNSIERLDIDHGGECLISYSNGRTATLK